MIILPKNKILTGIGVKGIWRAVHKDIHGNIKDIMEWHNLMTNEGWDHMLNTEFHGGTAITTWYFAPFIASYTPLVGDTYAVPGYTEATDTHYSEVGRQEWTEGASSGQSITNATAVTITSAGAYTFYGCGLVGGGTAATTKADTAGGGVLAVSGTFPTAKTLATSETLDLTYTIAKA